MTDCDYGTAPPGAPGSYGVPGVTAHQLYYGKYRGKVWNNHDPLQLGRLQVTVPAVPELRQGWAMPCVPYAGQGVGFYAMPPVNAGVWVEFEGGDPNYPVWSGCFWEEKQVPGTPDVTPDKKVFQTESISMVLDDRKEKGGFSLRVKPPVTPVEMSIVIDATGITLSCPHSTIRMTQESIELTVPPASETITARSIRLTVPQSELCMEARQVTVTTPPATATWTPEKLELAFDETTLDVASAAVAVNAPEMNIDATVNTTPAVNVKGPLNIDGTLSATGATTLNGGTALNGGGSVRGMLNVLGRLSVSPGGASILGPTTIMPPAQPMFP